MEVGRVDSQGIRFLDSGVPFAQVAEKFGDRFSLAQSVVPRLGPESGEMSIPGITKVAAIKTVQSRFGIPIEDTLAYGDGLNDLPMIEYVGTGVAMANARPEVL